MTVAGVCLLSASSVTLRICNVTYHGAAPGGPVALRPVRATPCYNNFGHEVAAGEKYTPCRLRFVVPFGRTTQYGRRTFYGRRTWIVISLPVSLQTPPDGRPPSLPPCTPPIDMPGLEARAPRRLALIGL